MSRSFIIFENVPILTEESQIFFCSVKIWLKSLIIEDKIVTRKGARSANKLFSYQH